MSSTVQARRTVLVSVFLLAAISLYRSKQAPTQGDTYKRLWGVGVIGLVLSVGADFVPTIAGPFAALAVLGSLTNGGDQVIQNALGKIGQPSAAAAGHTASSGLAPAGQSIGGTQ